MKGGKARPSRSIKKISGKLPEILQGAVAKCILQRPLCFSRRRRSRNCRKSGKKRRCTVDLENALLRISPRYGIIVTPRRPLSHRRRDGIMPSYA